MLQGQVALVTGASRGIGQAIALALGNAGATVVGTATSEKGAQAISDYLAAASIQGSGMKLNVTDAAEVDAVIAAIGAQFGDVGILVNNAGITRDNLSIRMAESDWDLVLAINLKGTFLCSQFAAKEMMKKRFGRIVNLASVSGILGTAGQANYAASKAGIIGLTKATAKELAARNITVNAIAPGFIVSAMTDKLPEDVKAKYIEAIPLGRLGTAEDVADAVLIYSSTFSSYTTGHVLNVDGGMVM